jgi:hypothetical protein
LLSLAFHPNYLTNGFFYIYYTNIAGAITIARYSRSTADVADASSGVIMLTIPKRFQNHNGGNLVFGAEGYLYFATGDGGSGGDPDNNAQNGASLLGKMLRLDVNNPAPPFYSIPPSNPFASSTIVKPEIIAVGLRNPWRWSFDKQTGDMWLADVGQNGWEEVNVVPAAAILNRNFGWSCFEGTHAFKNCAALPNNVTPVFEYGHNASGGYSITGGHVYRGAEFPSLQGYYLFADFATANGWLTKADGNGGWTTTMQQNWAAGISSFGEAGNGTLYATALNGNLFKVVASSALPVRLVAFTGTEKYNQFEINWQVQNEETGDIYIIEKRIKLSEPFVEISRTQVTNGQMAKTYSIKVPLTPEKAYYRLKIISTNNQVHFSGVISYNGNGEKTFTSFVAGKNLILTLPTGTTNVVAIDAVGRILVKQKTDPSINRLTLPLANAAKGVITVRILRNNEWLMKRIVY